jgi:polyphosphate kinase 2 (PPK2 family)
MGFCTKEEHRQFLRDCPAFGAFLVSQGIILLKYWLEVSKKEQHKRFLARIENYSKRWKLSPMDLESHRRWYDYSRARDAMLAATDTAKVACAVRDATIGRSLGPNNGLV